MVINTHPIKANRYNEHDINFHTITLCCIDSYFIYDPIDAIHRTEFVATSIIAFMRGVSEWRTVCEQINALLSPFKHSFMCMGIYGSPFAWLKKMQFRTFICHQPKEYHYTLSKHATSWCNEFQTNLHWNGKYLTGYVVEHKADEFTKSVD